jgi:uncharacterized protein YjbI with pentapeptide repeats
MRRIALVIVVAMISFVAAGSLSAYDESDLQKLKTTGNCVDCDLSGTVLIHWVLSGADLSGANLAGANLTDASLVGTNLAGANLSNAILEGASLAQANLFRVRLSGTNLFFTNLTGATWTDGSRCERRSSGWCKK